MIKLILRLSLIYDPLVPPSRSGNALARNPPTNADAQDTNFIARANRRSEPFSTVGSMAVEDDAVRLREIGEIYFRRLLRPARID